MLTNIQILREKFEQKKNASDEIQMTDIKLICKNLINDVSQSDFKSIFDSYLLKYSGETSLNYEEFIQFFAIIERQSQKVSFISEDMLCLSNLNSFITIKDFKIVSANYDIKNLQNMEIKGVQFQDICPGYFLNSLQKTKAIGLLNSESSKRVCSYTYNHKVQINQDIPIQEMNDSPQLQFLHLLWNFNFEEALNVLNILKNNQKFEEAQNLTPVLQELVEMDKIIRKSQELKRAFWNRKSAQINFEPTSFQEFSLTQTLQFTKSIIQGIIDLFKNPVLKLASVFISNDPQSNDNYELICNSQDIPIFSRFHFGKKFLPEQKFNSFKNSLIENALQTKSLENILLFGRSQKSKMFLQNYLDKTNDIRKVAIISVYLNGFVHEQCKEKALILEFNTYQQQYKRILQKLDSEYGYINGISRQKIFHEKCCQKKFWREKLFFTKTLALGCYRCGKSQLYREMKRTITNNFQEERKKKSNMMNIKNSEYFSHHPPSISYHCLASCNYIIGHCMVCLCLIHVYNPFLEMLKRDKRKKELDSSFLTEEYKKTQNIKNAFVFCPSCFHGGHYDHVKKWHEIHPKSCIIPDCTCECSF